jgi:hypothetical protein
MRWKLAAALVCLTNCSVYDDTLLQPARNARPIAERPVEPSRTPLAGAGGTASPALAADGGVRCATSTDGDYCARLPALPATPVFDGALECGLRLTPLPPVSWKGLGDAAPNKTASYAAAWQPDGLYVYVEVHGSSLAAHPVEEPVFCGDAIEIYVDADAQTDDAGTYDAMGTMQFVIAAPRDPAAAPDAWRFIQGKTQGTWITKSLRVSALPDGYSVEASIGASDLGLWQWNPKGELGFSVVVDVASDGPRTPTSAGCTAVSGQYFLRLGESHGNCPGEPWCDASAFCRAALLQP